MIAMNETELSIVMPCLNEAETLERCIVKAQNFLKEQGIKGEVVIGDNGSTDGSCEIAVRNGARVVEVRDKGYGNALKGAIRASSGKYVIMGDSDDSYDFSNLMPLVEKLREGNDLVMGNRFKGGIQTGAMPFLHRYLGNPVLSFLGRLLFGSRIGDFHCGLRGFSKESFNRMGLQTTGMEFATEMVMKASVFKMKVCEVPVKLYPDGRSRPPHLRTWRDGWRHLRFMLLYSPSWLFLYPGILLMLTGLTTGTFLVKGPVKINNVTFDLHTLVYMALLVLAGFQSVLFYCKTKIFAVNQGLLPESKNFEKIFRYFNLETGLIVSAVLILAGIGGTLWSFSAWREAGFQRLSPEEMMRMVIPSMLAFLLGIQIFFSSFFFSILGLKKILKE